MTSNTPRPQSAELRRRLAARARRVRLIRRRVGALALTVLAISWGAVYGLGALGASTATAVVLSAGSAARTTAGAATTIVTRTSRGAVTTTTTATSATPTASAASASPAATSSSGTVSAVTTSQS